MKKKEYEYDYAFDWVVKKQQKKLEAGDGVSEFKEKLETKLQRGDGEEDEDEDME